MPEPHEKEWAKYSRWVVDSLRQQRDDIKSIESHNDKFEAEIYSKLNELKDCQHKIELEAKDVYTELLLDIKERYTDIEILKKEIQVKAGIVSGVVALVSPLIYLLIKILEK